MKQKLKSAPVLMLAALGACVTPAPPKIVDSSCLVFKAITFAQLAPGLVNDPGNTADSPQTVGEIEAHNARYDALCLAPTPAAR